MTAPDGRDLVRLLRERLQHARDQLPLAREAGFDTTPLFEALDSLNDELSAERGPSRAVQTVARALLGMDDAAQWPACSQCGGSGHQPCAPGSPHPTAVSTDLTVAVADAMHYALTEARQDRLRVTSLTVALVAEHLIGQGWPARRPENKRDGTEYRVVAPNDTRLTEAAADLWALMHNGRRPEGVWTATIQVNASAQ